MPTHTINWEWEESFSKFGFGDGDDMVFTEVVADYIESLGYETQYSGGIHNSYFDSIKDKSGKEIIGEEVQIGYDDPRDYLPKSLIEKLDGYFNPDYVHVC